MAKAISQGLHFSEGDSISRKRPCPLRKTFLPHHDGDSAFHPCESFQWSAWLCRLRGVSPWATSTAEPLDRPRRDADGRFLFGTETHNWGKRLRDGFLPTRSAWRLWGSGERSLRAPPRRRIEKILFSSSSLPRPAAFVVWFTSPAPSPAAPAAPGTERNYPSMWGGRDKKRLHKWRNRSDDRSSREGTR